MRGDPEVWLVNNGDYWKAAWTDPLTGKPRSRSLGRQDEISKRQGKVLCRDIANELKMKTSGEAVCLSEWLKLYAELRSDVKETTRKTYRECARYLLAHFAADPPIDRITRADASTWLAAMSGGTLTQRLNEAERADALASGTKRARYMWRVPKLATVRRHVRAARTMFLEAARQDRIPFNPFDRLVGTPPRVTKTWAEITPADLARILDACPHNGWRALFALARLNGLRLGEALALRWTDVDWAGNRIRVNERLDTETTKQAWRVTPLEPGKCPTGMTAMLRGWFEAAPAGTVRVCEGVGVNNLRRDALGVIRRASLPPYAKPFHTLRKNRVSEVAIHYPQGVVEDWFGHDAQVSREHYQRVPEELYAPPIMSKTMSKPEAVSP